MWNPYGEPAPAPDKEIGYENGHLVNLLNGQGAQLHPATMARRQVQRVGAIQCYNGDGQGVGDRVQI